MTASAATVVIGDERGHLHDDARALVAVGGGPNGIAHSLEQPSADEPRGGIVVHHQGTPERAARRLQLGQRRRGTGTTPEALCSSDAARPRV